MTHARPALRRRIRVIASDATASSSTPPPATHPPLHRPRRCARRAQSPPKNAAGARVDRPVADPVIASPAARPDPTLASACPSQFLLIECCDDRWNPPSTSV